MDWAMLVQRLELSVVNVDLALMLDANLPVCRLGESTEASQIHDIPLIDAGRARPLDLLGAWALRLDEPVNVFGSETLGVVHVQLTALGPLGIFPVDLLAAGFHDMEVQV